MNRQDVHKLLGGYATGTLTEEERKALFAAALEDQELFEALADEEALREVLADLGTRRRLIADLTGDQPSFWAAARVWLHGGRALALAGAAAVVAITFTSVRLWREAPMEVAQVKHPAAVREPAPTLERESPPNAAQSARQEAFRSSGGGTAVPQPSSPPVAEPEAKEKASPSKDAGALTEARGRDEERRVVGELGKTEAAAKKVLGAVRADQAPAGPLRVVVLNSPARPSNGPESQRQLESAMTTQLGQKLNQPPGYAVVDQREVDKVLADRKLTNQELDASTAAGLGRALNADAVVVSNLVQMQPAPVVQTQAAPPPPPKAASPAGQAADSNFQKQGLRAKRAREQSQAAAQAVNVFSAEVIDTRNEARRFKAVGNVDQVASQVSTQLAQLRSPGPPIQVRSVSSATVALDAGSRQGLTVGTRLEIRRQGRLLGEVTVISVTEDAAEGTFAGPEAPRAGDEALSK